MSAWLEEDPELLRATLALIDTWSEDSDLDYASLSAVSATSGTTASSASSSEAQDSTTTIYEHEEPFVTEHEESPDGEADRAGGERPRANPSLLDSSKAVSTLATNQRRRAEIHTLQVQIRAMEVQIATLQGGKPQPLTGAIASTTVSLPLGQQIVENQRRLRRKSELERAKLRKLLQAHQTIVQGMTKSIRDAQALQEETEWLSLKLERAKARTQRYNPHSADLFQRVELMYARQDAVFAHRRFNDGSSRFVDMEIQDNFEREIVLEFREAWTVPFEPLAVLDALWLFTKKRVELKCNSPGQQVSVDTADAFLTQFSSQGSIDHCLFSFAGQLLLKRYDNCNAQELPAIVTHMMSVPNRDSLDGPLQVWMHDQSCTRLLPVIGSSRRSPMTRVQSTYQVSVQFDDDDKVTSRRHAATLANFILSKLQNDVQVKQNYVQTFLV